MARIERVQDPVHGLMIFEDMETSVVEILRAKEVQRLRRIRQLGLVHFVFPGAEHSRLVHSLGCAYLAIRFARQIAKVGREFLSPLLLPGPTTIRDLALAALFHDLGHGPLSHIWEHHAIGEDFNRTSWITSLGLDLNDVALTQLKWHELVGQSLLAWTDGELHKLLEQQEVGSSQRLRQLLLGNYHPVYLPRLLSSDVDVDRCDFILRDAQQTGVAYGRCDVNWLISTLSIGTTTDDKLILGFDMRKAPPVIEQLLVARRALYHTVYFHKTVRAAESMIGLILKRIRDVPEILNHQNISAPLFEPYRKVLRGEALRPAEVLALDDYSLWALMQSLASATNIDRTANDLARRIIERDLFKLVPCEPRRLSAFMIRDDAYERLRFTVRPYCQGDASYYVYVDNANFDMLCDDESKRAYFVNTESENRLATPIREHERILPHRRSTENLVRLFVPRQALDAVYELIQ